MDERQALEQCRSGSNPRAFEFLVEKYRREAFYHAVGFMGNEHDAADACQEAFTRAYAALPKLNQISQFYPWYYRILKNLCLNALRKRKRADAHIKEERRAARAWRQYDPAILVERDERKELVWELLGEMEPKFREILVLKHFRGLSYTVISERIGIPRGTVMSRLFHARKKFQALFTERCRESEQRSEVDGM